MNEKLENNVLLGINISKECNEVIMKKGVENLSLREMIILILHNQMIINEGMKHINQKINCSNITKEEIEAVRKKIKPIVKKRINKLKKKK